MTDSSDRALAAIDARLADGDRLLADIDARLNECVAGCGKPATGPLYCGEECQTRSMAATVEPLDEPSLDDIGYRRFEPGDGTIRFEPVD